MAKMFALQQTWARVYFFYFDQLPSCEERWDPKALDDQPFSGGADGVVSLSLSSSIFPNTLTSEDPWRIFIFARTS